MPCNRQRVVRSRRRRGAVVVLAALFIIPLLAMVAFAVDYGYLINIQTDLQRSADAAALAAVQDLVPDPDGSQDVAATRAAAQTYAANNIGGSFQVLGSDIEIGQYDAAQIYSNVVLVNAPPYDSVRVLLRRDDQANSPVGLYFAQAVGITESSLSASATAILQKSKLLEPGADVLPFAVPEDVWDARAMGEEWSIYGDGKVVDSFGNTIPGNWGTVDIGSTNNSTSDLNDQILNGLRQSDLDALYGDGRIGQSTYIDGEVPAWMQADTGLSSGLKHSVQQIHGKTRIVPIYDINNGASGNNLEFHIVKWGVVVVVTSNWSGANNTNVTIMKSYAYMGDLRPQTDLSNETGLIEGAYTVPALVE